MHMDTSSVGWNDYGSSSTLCTAALRLSALAYNPSLIKPPEIQLKALSEDEKVVRNVTIISHSLGGLMVLHGLSTQCSLDTSSKLINIQVPMEGTGATDHLYQVCGSVESRF